ncbi:GMC family oxidoreductase [Nesterenkonia halophila]|uniref:GMC family oxidoreductase n=1 Tax=Nesterenkonia halophila TaxID=302044 RepID=UPI001292308B|nr:GMC family oxidoreductase N-terminal domain-containing protein [Nesterenkonia halophila]
MTSSSARIPASTLADGVDGVDGPTPGARPSTAPGAASGPGATALVVGAGSAGCVVARRLVDAGVAVTLLEAGGEDHNPAIHDLSRMGELWHGPEDWDYYTVGMEGTAGQPMHLPRGKVLGGSHALNATIWVRGAPSDFDGWAVDCGPDWSWEQVLPIYRALEDSSSGADELRGTGGPLVVDGDYPLEPIHRAIVEAAVESGVPYNSDYNGETLDGVSQQQVTIRDGERANTWKAHLQPVRDRLRILTGAHVHSVIVEDGAAVGVRLGKNGEERELRADQVVLCAGALDSPQILLRSGLGPAEELREAGVDVVRDMPGVGKNLHDHLLAPVIGVSTSREVDPPRPGVSVTQTHLFARSRPDLTVPDTQPIFFAVPMYSPGMEEVEGTAFTLHSGLVAPRSRGEITLSGPGLEDPARIDLAALSDPADVEALLFSLRQCRDILAQPALAEGWGATEVHPGPEVTEEGELIDYIRRCAVTYHHQVGTCRMGVDDGAVVDPRLRVRGLDGLRVVDASIMPTITTGNTNAPTIMIGEQGARFIREDLGLGRTAVRSGPADRRAGVAPTG